MSFIFSSLVVFRPDEVKNSSKSTANEFRGRNSSRPLNAVSQRQKQTAASRGSADAGTAAAAAAGGMHEEWETASESSDVLKDSDSQQQSQSARGGRHRQDSRRGYSNQRHTQSRRGRYRDRPAADVDTANERETGSARSVDTRLNQTDSASVSVVDSSRGHGSFPSSDPSGPNGNIHPVYRLDHIVYDDPFAIQTAISDVFVRCVMY